MTDMPKIIEKANSAGYRVMEDARYGKPDECVDWEGVFDRVVETILATLAAEMAAAGLKVVKKGQLSGKIETDRDIAEAMIYAALTHDVAFTASTPEVSVSDMWDCAMVAATCELQAALNYSGEE